MNQVSQDSEDNVRASPGNNNNKPSNMTGHGSNNADGSLSTSGNGISSATATAMISVAGTNSGPGKEPVNGHLDPSRRRVYLLVFSFSIVNAIIGLMLILVWMLNYRPVTGFGLSSAGQMANLHPLLMYTFMVSLNMYSVLIYRTHYAQPKSQLKWTHAILSGANILMSLLGVAAMFKAHLMSNQANFYSLHSWIGAATNTFYLIQFVAGALAFLRPGWTTQAQRAKLMPWHRIAGTTILVLAALAAITGIAELVIFQDSKTAVYAKFAPITYIANFAGVAIILMTASTVYLLAERAYLRPALPEEAPLKR